jgi:hypothetical protein
LQAEIPAQSYIGDAAPGTRRDDHDHDAGHNLDDADSWVNWQSWAMRAAGAFFGAPYLEADTAHAAWVGFMHNLRIRLTR